MNKNKFYVTTPIYYVNAKPHLGTLYSTVLADVAARWQKLLGKEVFFLTGTDEHGNKIQERAHELGMTPRALVDSVSQTFVQMWKLYGIEYDKFIRTTDTEHVNAVIALIKKLQKNGDIYKSQYSGLYCVPCETFVSVSSDELEKDEQGNFLCPSCKRPVKQMEEETYFFRLSAYQDQLLEFYEKNPHFITPKERVNEIISFVKTGLKDLSISRKTVRWGIPFPGDPDHTVYVWCDALTNYLSAIGYGGDDALNQDSCNFWWPADVHMMAKDIVRFHAVYWPAFLMSAGLPLPKTLLVHGYILSGDKKMSKSLGNAIDPYQLADWYGTEQVRYYLLRQMAVNQDGQFTLQDLENRVGGDLANNLGNLLNRTVALALANGLQKVAAPEAWEPAGVALHQKCEEAFRLYWDNMNHYQYHVALADLWKFVSEVNAYFHEQKPWELVKKNKELFAEIISASCHSLYAIAIMLWPVTPKKMEELLGSLGQQLQPKKNYDSELRKYVWNKTFDLKKTEQPLFPRPESHVVVEESVVQDGAAVVTPGASAKKSVIAEASIITVDDFAKVELLVGTILECTSVVGSDKLYQLRVDFGLRGQRTILSGVAKYLKPEDLVGKQGVYVGNLAPRKMMNLESQGMMLFAKDDQGNFEMVTVSSPVANGTRLS